MVFVVSKYCDVEVFLSNFTKPLLAVPNQTMLPFSVIDITSPIGKKSIQSTCAEALLTKKIISGDYERMNKKSFMSRYGNKIRQKSLDTDYRQKVASDIRYNDAKAKLFRPSLKSLRY